MTYIIRTGGRLERNWKLRFRAFGGNWLSYFSNVFDVFTLYFIPYTLNRSFPRGGQATSVARSEKSDAAFRVATIDVAYNLK